MDSGRQFTKEFCAWVILLGLPLHIIQQHCTAIGSCFPLPPSLPPSFLPAAFLTQTVNLDDTTVKFEIWDTAGQERYHSLAPMYYRGAQAAIVVYDITNAVGLHSN